MTKIRLMNQVKIKMKRRKLSTRFFQVTVPLIVIVAAYLAFSILHLMCKLPRNFVATINSYPLVFRS